MDNASSLQFALSNLKVNETWTCLLLLTSSEIFSILCNKCFFENLKYNIINENFKSISCHDILGVEVFFLFWWALDQSRRSTYPRLTCKTKVAQFFKPSDEGTLVSSTHLLHKVRTQCGRPYVTTHVFCVSLCVCDVFPGSIFWPQSTHLPKIQQQNVCRRVLMK